MKTISKVLTFFFISVFFITLIPGCDTTKTLENTVLLGTIAGPETELAEVAKQVAKEKYNLDVHVIPFNDYVEPNRALAQGEINANMFQHQPYLDIIMTEQTIKLVPIAKLFIYPMGVYSEKYKSLNDIPKNATVALPKDSSNRTRALWLLEKAGLITLNTTEKNNVGIIANPNHLIFENIEPEFMIKKFTDYDLAAINTNYAIMGGLYPNHDALIMEDANSLYANIIVVRENDKDNAMFQKLIKSLQSPEVIAKSKILFNNQAVAAW